MKRHTLAVAVVAVLGLSLAGVGAAQTYENLSSSDMPVNETVTPDTDTETLRVIGENITNDNASVTVYEIDNGTETQVATGSVNTDEANGTYMDSFDFDAVNTSLEYRALVEGDGADMIAINKVNVVAAGAGGGGGGGLAGDLPDWVFAVVVGVLVGTAGMVASRVRD